MRHLNAELQKDGAICPGHIEQRSLGSALHEHERARFSWSQVCDVLDMASRDDHRVPTNSGVGVEKDVSDIAGEHDLAGGRQVIAEKGIAA